MKPYYELNEETQKLIMGLVNKCIEMDLGNVSFNYFYTRNPDRGEIVFIMRQTKCFWELLVSLERTKERDKYHIIDGIITYQYSEADR